MPSTTPRSTLGDRARVATSVKDATPACPRVTLVIRQISSNRMSGYTATITTAPSTARGREESTPANGMNARTARPVKAAAQRVRAPAKWLMELRENDPPTGNPPEIPEVMLAMPIATSSRLASQCSRSRTARVREMAVASAKPTSAITAPGMRRSGIRAQGMSNEKGGSPSGIVPTSSAV